MIFAALPSHSTNPWAASIRSIRALLPRIVTPPASILAEPPVALVDKVVDRRRTRAPAEGYLNFLYSPLAQDLIGKNFYRPRNVQAAAKYGASFPKLNLVTIDETFGGWKKAQTTHFGDGGVFDQIYKPA